MFPFLCLKFYLLAAVFVFTVFYWSFHLSLIAEQNICVCILFVFVFVFVFVSIFIFGYVFVLVTSLGHEEDSNA